MRGAGLFSDSRVSNPGMGKITDTESLVLMLSLLLLLVMVVTSESDTPFTLALDTLLALLAPLVEALLDFLSLFLLLPFARLGVFTESDDDDALLWGVIVGSKESRVFADVAMATDPVMFMVEDRIVEGCMPALAGGALLLLPFLLFDFGASCFDEEVVGGLSSWKS